MTWRIITGEKHNDCSSRLRVARRLVLVFVLQAAFIMWLKSDTLTSWTGRPLAGRLHFGPEPMFLALLFGILLVRHLEADGTRESWGPMSVRWSLAGVVGWVVVASVSIVLAHPLPPYNSMFVNIDGTTNLLATAVRQSVVMAMFVPAVCVVLPPAFLRARRKWFMMTGLSVSIYLWIGALRIAFHRPLATIVLSIAGTVLNWLSPGTTVDLVELSMTSGPFTAVIGAQCLGLDGIALFLCLWSACWAVSADRYPVDHIRAAGALVFGSIMLVTLNIIRIVILMQIAARYPHAGVSLFHEALGPAMFMVVFVALLPSLRQRGNRIDHERGGMCYSAEDVDSEQTSMD